MMVDPEGYYEEHLKGKPVNQIKAQIRSLEKEINRLQAIVAKPECYQEDWMIRPSPEVQLKMQRLYLQKAKEVLAGIIEYLK